MRKICTFIICSVLSITLAKAQLTLVDNTAVKPVRCFTAESIEAIRKANPNSESEAEFENWISSAVTARKAARVPVVNYTLPIVFHIIYDGEAEGTGYNISQANIQQQVLQLNKDYGNYSNSPYSVAINSGIQFQLAAKDPSGNTLAQPGIDRVNRNTKGWSAPPYTAGYTNNSNNFLNNTIKPATIWDPTKYINVWVLYLESGLLGIATFPASSTLSGLSSVETATTSGVSVSYSTIGSVFAPSGCSSSNPYNTGRTLTHELGHYFGLRHIWGDTNCGTDYCDDTPVHYTSNTGEPVHPKSNSCGTTDEMFENYMDYSDDKVLNTFTADQVDRMQIVMLNSPRRSTLPTSDVGLVPVTGSNKVAFSDCYGSTTISESGTLGTYPRYKDVLLYLNVEDTATGSATVSFVTGGTATNNTHYQLLTPTATFVAGDKVKPVTVRIFDNATVDGDRTITLSYTIAGTGVVANTSSQSYQINIKDDDSILIGQNTINLLNEGFETSNQSVPTGWSVLSSTSYPNLFTVGTNGDAGGSGQCAYVSNTYTSTKSNTYTVGTSGQTVLQSPVIDPNSVQSLGSLSFKYKVRGSSTDYGILTYAYSNQLTGGPFYYWGSTNGYSGYGPYYGTTSIIRSNNVSLGVPSAIQSSKFAVNFFWITGTATLGGSPGLNIDDVILPATPFSIETIVANSYKYDLPSSTANNIFRSTNSRVIATLNNATTTIAGVAASITEAGTDRPTISTNGTTYLRSRKVIKVLPVTTNNTVQYNIKLYFTTAEIAAWGTSITAAKIIKIADGTSFSDDLNTVNAVVVTPKIDDLRTTDGYITFSATVTGFGSFALVENATILPVSLLDFTANFNTNAILLKWSTSFEYNNKGFEVQRGLDGTNFAKIGWVNSVNNASGSMYTYNDVSINKGTTYYYRLKQVDADGNFAISKVVTATYNSIDNVVFQIYPNPISDKLIIQNMSATVKANIIITDVLGKTIYQQQILQNSTNTVNTTLWAKGLYLIKLYSTTSSITQKIIKD